MPKVTSHLDAIKSALFRNWRQIIVLCLAEEEFKYCYEVSIN